MPSLYELGILGSPTDAQVEALTLGVAEATAALGLVVGRDVALTIGDAAFKPASDIPSGAVYFGGAHTAMASLESVLRRGIPVVPIVSSLSRVSVELPEELRRYNSLAYDTEGPTRTVNALLECVGLLPAHRRVFLSYRRDEARQA